MMSKVFQDPIHDSIKIPLSLIDHVMPNVVASSWCVLLVIFQATKGCHNKSVQISTDQFKEKTGIKSEITIRSAMQLLVQKGYIAMCFGQISPQDAMQMLKDKVGQENVSACLTCEWCSGTTFALQSHHFPVSAKDGGTETVAICANCHYEYHYLVDRRSYKLGDKIPRGSNE